MAWDFNRMVIKQLLLVTCILRYSFIWTNINIQQETNKHGWLSTCWVFHLSFTNPISVTFRNIKIIRQFNCVENITWIITDEFFGISNHWIKINQILDSWSCWQQSAIKNSAICWVSLKFDRSVRSYKLRKRSNNDIPYTSDTNYKIQ